MTSVEQPSKSRSRQKSRKTKSKSSKKSIIINESTSEDDPITIPLTPLKRTLPTTDPWSQPAAPISNDEPLREVEKIMVEEAKKSDDSSSSAERNKDQAEDPLDITDMMINDDEEDNTAADDRRKDNVNRNLDESPSQGSPSTSTEQQQEISSSNDANVRDVTTDLENTSLDDNNAADDNEKEITPEPM